MFFKFLQYVALRTLDSLISFVRYHMFIQMVYSNLVIFETAGPSIRFTRVSVLREISLHVVTEVSIQGKISNGNITRLPGRECL